jgi:hypothetical protein
MTHDQMVEMARGNIERHLGDVVEEGMPPEAIFEEAYVLAFDALADAGVEHSTARGVAQEVSKCFE